MENKAQKEHKYMAVIPDIQLDKNTILFIKEIINKMAGDLGTDIKLDYDDNPQEPTLCISYYK